jgi:hypothetical protein
MLNYSDTHGKLPPAVVYSKDGRPLLSWRVLILPYLEEDKLYNQFKLDEPWDSPNNLPLLGQMPLVYALPPRKARGVPPNHTICHVFVGPGTAFEDPNGQKLRDFPDGISNTVLIFEGGVPVPWTKPEEIPFDPEQPLTVPKAYFKRVFRIAFADGSVHHLSHKIVEEGLRPMITRNGDDKWSDGTNWPEQ